MGFIITAINNGRAMAAKAATPTMTEGTCQITSSHKAPRVHSLESGMESIQVIKQRIMTRLLLHCDTAVSKILSYYIVYMHELGVVHNT